jgi:hypothetical protein
MVCLYFDHFNLVSNAIDAVIVKSALLEVDLGDQTLAD